MSKVTDDIAYSSHRLLWVGKIDDCPWDPSECGHHKEGLCTAFTDDGKLQIKELDCPNTPSVERK